MMQARPLGRSDLKTLPLSLGGNAIGWTADAETSFAVIDHFVGAGYSLIDTADMYSKWVLGHVGGESEAIIGAWAKSRGKRDKILIATKLGGEMGPDKKGLSAKYIKAACDASLQRLQTDYIDLYQAHFDDESVPYEETLGAFSDLIAAGKVRAIGASNYSVERFEGALAASAAHGLPRYETYQPLYNLYDRQAFETGFGPLCGSQGIGVISFYALASGFLSGKYRTEADLDSSARKRTNSKYMTERGFRILAALDAVAARTGFKQAQIAVAWIIAQPNVTAPIASATSVAQVQELIAAAQLTLDAESLALLAEASAD